MSGTRKRKHVVVDDQQPSKQTSSSKTQTGMTRFTAVSKAGKQNESLKKRKVTHEPQAKPTTLETTPDIRIATEKKRKRGQDLDGASDDERSTQGSEQDASGVAHSARKTASKTNKRVRNAPPPSPAATPSRTAAALFDRLHLGTKSLAIPFSLNARPVGYETPPHTPDVEKTEETLMLPPELYDLVQLHSAFLTAVSLYYAHNGTTSPANVGAILPMITKNFKKRSVTLIELQRLLGIGQQDFVLEDFGRAGICLSRAKAQGRAGNRAVSYIDEDDMNSRFEQAINDAWLKWQSATGEENQSAQAFLNQLPLSSIITNESTQKAAPLFARGQQRLADLKAGQTAAKAEIVKASSVDLAEEQKTTEAVQKRGMNLLDRILAKQAVTASMPAGPTKEQLERKAALHRVEAIARVLELLAAGKPRASFSMPVMVQQLQQSLRNPISREEVEQCLQLMADEVTPGFVSVVVSGAVKGVVITRAGKMSSDDLKARVEEVSA